MRVPRCQVRPHRVFRKANIDGLARSAKAPFSVIPAKAGIQEKQAILDPGFRRGDGFDDFLRTHQYWPPNNPNKDREAPWILKDLPGNL
jgi:hypothetical protein